MQCNFSPLIPSQKNLKEKKALCRDLFWSCWILWWSMPGFGWSQRGLLAQDKPTMLREDASLQKAQEYHFSGRISQGSPEQLPKPAPKLCFAGNIPWHSPVFPEVSGSVFLGGHSNPLSPCLYFLPSSEHGSWKWTWYSVYCPSEYYFI